MNQRIKNRSLKALNVVLLIATVLIFLFAFFVGNRFDFSTLGYLVLIVLSPTLVLSAADMIQTKKTARQ
jgi:hypothetical protein